jgi:hypothetical protein
MRQAVESTAAWPFAYILRLCARFLKLWQRLSLSISIAIGAHVLSPAWRREEE